MRLKDKVAVITGGASGFGEVMARRFVAEGGKVMVADLNAAGAKAVADSIGDAARSIGADVTKAAEADAMIAATVDAFGKLDILVNNAGAPQFINNFEDVTEDEIDLIFNVNVKSWLLTSRAAIPHLASNGGGSIINTASVAGLRPRAGAAWYNASKAAACSLTLTMAAELAAKNIRVNALCPVAAETPLFEGVVGEITDAKRERFTATIPLGRLAVPDDVASAAVYLASDEATFMTGVLLPIDGGRTAM
jgi:3-oxoacyl-[acyl-carrier protein] reductase